MTQDERPTVTLRATTIKDTRVWASEGYIFWPDPRLRGWRWAKEHWADDGVGLQHHGAAATLEAAVAAAREHAALCAAI